MSKLYREGTNSKNTDGQMTVWINKIAAGIKLTCQTRHYSAAC
jgi:hypothetical protein